MNFKLKGIALLFAESAVLFTLLGCGGSGNATSTAQSAGTPAPGAPAPGAPGAEQPVVPSAIVLNPIMFAAQVPTLQDFAGRASTFGNHRAENNRALRGGDLMIRYPDGSLRNLTKEAGYGVDGFQGSSAIAVREPSVHWNGRKALFSMVIGAPAVQFQSSDYAWQIYEVSGLAKGETATITKLANQPMGYNNISPIYGTDGRILFTTDRPRGGEAHLYPQLDEYESTPTVTGIWSLSPATGDLRLLNHAPSGAFSPTIDSYGRVAFIRWDHLQRDQQAEGPDYGAYNYSDEGALAAKLGSKVETFPEPRAQSTSVFGAVAGLRNNRFTPWEMNEDGTEEETLNHVGMHEMAGSFIPKSFMSDSALSDNTDERLHANRKMIRGDGGLFHMREDPARPGTYYAVYAREFGFLSADQIIKFNGGAGTNPEAMVFSDVTRADNVGGRFRNPLPLTDGNLIASHTPVEAADFKSMLDIRLKQLIPDGTTGLYKAGPPLTAGIRKSISYWDPDKRVNFSGLLWELEAVEVVARAVPTRAAKAIEAPERAVFTEEAVDEVALRNWLRSNDLAMIVTRNQTSRDRADVAQPFNLQVPGGIKKVSPNGGKVYDIAHFQVFQADQVRAYSQLDGRRPIAQPMHDPKVKNPANAGGPAGSVKIALDGSTAAFVPARRALTWQSTDPAGNAVVRERVWVTMQPGEVRVCASCHGLNTSDQAGAPPPTNKPEALRELLRFWKSLPK